MSVKSEHPSWVERSMWNKIFLIQWSKKKELNREKMDNHRY